MEQFLMMNGETTLLVVNAEYLLVCVCVCLITVLSQTNMTDKTL